jgi:hypothetical protein
MKKTVMTTMMMMMMSTLTKADEIAPVMPRGFGSPRIDEKYELIPFALHHACMATIPVTIESCCTPVVHKFITPRSVQTWMSFLISCRRMPMAHSKKREKKKKKKRGYLWKNKKAEAYLCSSTAILLPSIR